MARPTFFRKPVQETPPDRHFTFGGEYLDELPPRESWPLLGRAAVNESDSTGDVRRAEEPRSPEEKLRAREEELALTRAQLMALLDALGDAVWIKDEKLRYVAINAGVLRILAQPAAEVIGRTARDLVPADRAERYETEDRAALEGIFAGSTLEEVEEPDKGKRLLAVLRRPVLDQKGIVIGVIGIARDVTEQRELEQRLVQSQKMDAIGRLAGGVAHDFNNMLTAIQGYSSLLLTELPERDSRRENVEEILKASERATALTKQLLAFSRRQVLEPRVLDLNEVVRNLSRMLSRLIGENIELSVSPAPDLWHVLADPGQIEQVLLNLAINARDAMPRGGRLTIETRNTQLDGSHWRKDFPVQSGDYSLLAVTDTGVGIPPEIQTRLFEPFFTTKPRGEGTGLGLSTVYGIVKQSGGYIWVYSEPGAGSTFKVYLPRVDAALTASETPRTANSASGSETILFVEDEREVRSLVEKLLRLQGYKVLSAADPAAALAHARGHSGVVDLLITDVMLPGLSGRDLAQQIQKLKPEIPILFISGYSDDAVVRHGNLDAGTHFLQKPFTPLQLGKKIREILDAR
jgi:two-component system cell cycle sensor histidine kinase/response regulator CckA